MRLRTVLTCAIALFAIAACGFGPNPMTSVVVAIVNATPESVSAWWHEGSSDPGTPAQPYTIAACEIQRFGFRGDTTTTVAVATATGRHDVIVKAPPTVPAIRYDAITVEMVDVTYVIDDPNAALPSPCPAR